MDASNEALYDGDADYFAERLPKSEHYRIAVSFPKKTAFLDIETTGLSHYYDDVTIVGISLDGSYSCHFAFDDESALLDRLREAKCVVTFNGTIFDYRFLIKTYSNIQLPKAHVDLRFLAPRAGLSGGQKVVEEKLGWRRHGAARDINGAAAPLLWHRYKLGDHDAAKTLIRYNHADVEGMRFILDSVLEKMAGFNGQGAIFHRPTFEKQTTRFTWSKHSGSFRKNVIAVPSFRGGSGPAVTMAEIAPTDSATPLRVVGIDLTGSERRPTGWCLMRGAEAETCLLSTDDEIIEASVDAHPDVVSIDSPLSIPRGRTRVSDDDPSRQSGGIMRDCERELKRRGINVYPCLIPSMQGLTQRGMRLAHHLRERGIPVIESYPGAAQDIMGIPRKRAGLEYLKGGLADFGVRGAFVTSKVNHDELDAITAALVGFFFWSGRFEPLGNEDEDYLIVPDLRCLPERWTSRRVIGISGEICAGKTSAARHLQRAGFAYGRFSQILESMLNQGGVAVSRENLQGLGERVNREPGQRWLCKQLVKQLPGGRDLVIDGLRWRMDRAFLRERFGPAFVHLHVEASMEIRRQRFVPLGNSEEEFERASCHPAEAEARALAYHAETVIPNERALGDFLDGVDRVTTQRLDVTKVEPACL
ncbi:MAG: DUF429 domain-containing protein [Rhodospirillales bacterium]|nr:DUF429 domain-containing protein [Rhodospirillales bacterium]